MADEKPIKVSPLTITEAARTDSLEALRTLRKWMRHKTNGRAAIAAANAILDRGFGKPAQHVVPHVPTDKHPTEMTDAEIEQRLQQLRGADSAPSGDAASTSRPH